MREAEFRPNVFVVGGCRSVRRDMKLPSVRVFSSHTAQEYLVVPRLSFQNRISYEFTGIFHPRGRFPCLSGFQPVLFWNLFHIPYSSGSVSEQTMMPVDRFQLNDRSFSRNKQGVLLSLNENSPCRRGYLMRHVTRAVHLSRFSWSGKMLRPVPYGAPVSYSRRKRNRSLAPRAIKPPEGGFLCALGRNLLHLSSCRRTTRVRHRLTVFLARKTVPASDSRRKRNHSLAPHTPKTPLPGSFLVRSAGIGPATFWTATKRSIH